MQRNKLPSSTSGPVLCAPETVTAEKLGFISPKPVTDSGSLPVDRESSANRYSCCVFIGSRQVLAASKQIQGLRLQVGQNKNATSDPAWFVNSTLALSHKPWIVVLFHDHQLVAALYLSERLVRGIPSGYLKAEGMDEDFFICSQRSRAMYFPLLMDGLFAKRSSLIAHVAQLASADTAYSKPSDCRSLEVLWKQGLYHHRLRLFPTLQETLAGYGSHTRRNIRYYIRKARSEGYTFIAELTKEQRLVALSQLQGHATHKITAKSVEFREAAVQSVPDSFSMGVHSPSGDWLSYLAGWRTETKTFVYWQMNRSANSSSSFGTAIRAFLMEEEIARGATEIIFLGGSSEVFKRCCEVDESVHLIVRRKGVRGWLLARTLERTVVDGHPLQCKG